MRWFLEMNNKTSWLPDQLFMTKEKTLHYDDVFAVHSFPELSLNVTAFTCLVPLGY